MKMLLDQEHFLEIRAEHRDSKYRVTFTRYTDLHNGLVEFTPFTDGNFSVIVSLGRKSQKKLERINNYISDYKSELFQMWKDSDYESICKTLFNFGRTL